MLTGIIPHNVLQSRMKQNKKISQYRSSKPLQMSSNITGNARDFLHLLQWKKKQFILLHVPSSLKTSKQNNNKHQKAQYRQYRIGSLQNYCKTRF